MTRSIYKNIGWALLCSLAFVLPAQLQAQCSGGSNAGSIAPSTSFQTIGCVQGGQYYTFSATNGTSYTFTFCQGGGSASYDTQLTILNNSGAYAGGYSDDVCGSGSEITWTAPSNGTYRVLINNYYCSTGSTCATLAYRENAPIGPGSTCGNPYIIPALPFSQTGRTTCGYGDDYSSADACASIYMDGDDFVYRYTSPGNENISITLTNTSTYVGLFVLDGCPSSGSTNCLPLATGGGGAGCGSGGGATNTSSSGNPFGTWTLSAAGTYYIVISTWPSPQCTPFDISITSSAAGGGGGAPVGCYTQSNIPYVPENYNTGTTVTFPDDEHSPVIPIGFTFCFMGSQYTDFVISSNGYITFNTSCSGQYSPWTTTTLPSATYPETNNAIHLCWQDIDPSVSGTIRYRVYGTAPNRRLVVIFDDIAYFSVACNNLTFAGQLIIYETTGVIDLLIGDKVICPTWNSGNASQGLVAPGGAFAITTAGRNNTNWTASSEAIRFTPSCNVCTVPLDANYTQLSGVARDGHNIVRWQTSMERDLEGFVLERSLNGETFDEVGTQVALGQSGAGSDYEMRDDQPFYPVTYYRLRELNSDGQVTYSEVFSVITDATALAIEYVTAVQGELEVGITALQATDNVRIEVVDGLGRLVLEKAVRLENGSNSFLMPVHALSPGYYTLRVSTPAGRSVKKFILQ